jgi:AAHS family 4-hydroxybenzoate transporter-like MFS transporter
MRAGRREVDLGVQLDSAPFGRVALRVSLLTLLALVFDGFDIQAIAFAAPALLSEWSMTRAELGPVLAAGLVGMGIGALTLGTLGDRQGRRRALIACMLLIAVASLLSAYAGGPTELTLWRLATGIGLGGALPNATALVVEFTPARIRSLIVAVTVVGVPIGGMLGSAVAAEVVPRLGWRSIFLIGAALPGLLAAGMTLLLPESPRFLVTRPARQAELSRLMNRVRPDGNFNGTEDWLVPRAAAEHALRPGVRALFAPAFRHDTIVIWLIFFTNVFSVYAYFNWNPTVLTGAGLPLATALRGALVFNLGGVVGSLVGAWAMTRLGSRPVLLALGAGAVLSTFAIGQIPIGPDADLTLLYALVLIAGACISGVQVQMYTVAAQAYPTQIRATGVGWGLGVARIGGVLSSFAGSMLLAMGSGVTPFFSGIAAVLTVTLTGLAMLRSHLRPDA